MVEEVQDYVRSCDTCQRDKASRHKKYGLLDPLEIPYRPWSSISMDWIVKLPESGGYTQIWVIVDRLTKMAHFIPLKTGITAAELAQAFLRVIWKLHGLPDEIITDRDTKITSLFWQKLMDLMGTISKMMTAFHPQSDRQTERINQILEEYLQHYCSWKQDDWDELLPLAEYAYNSAISETTKMSPFYTNYRFEPKQSFKPIGKIQYQNPRSEVQVKMWENIWEQLKANIIKAQIRMTKWYDNKKQEGPDFKEGDMVMLNSRYIQTKRPSKKLDHKKMGPFRIEKAIGNRAFRLELPPQMKVHPVYHIGLLERYRDSKDPTRKQIVPEVEEIDGEMNWEVREIVESRQNRRKKHNPIEYLVLWEGYPDEDGTWEVYDNLKGTANEILQNFHNKYPHAARDARIGS